MAEILKVDPDWESLSATIPPNIQMLLKRCLQKDRKQRLRDIGEAWVLIEAALAGDTSMMGLTAYEVSKVASWRRLIPWTLAAVLAIAAGISWMIPRSTEQLTQRFTVSIPEKQQPIGMIMPTLAISSNGKLLVFRGQSELGAQLYLRRINQLESSRNAVGTRERRDETEYGVLINRTGMHHKLVWSDLQVANVLGTGRSIMPDSR